MEELISGSLQMVEGDNCLNCKRLVIAHAGKPAGNAYLHTIAFRLIVHVTAMRCAWFKISALYDDVFGDIGVLFLTFFFK